MFYTPNLTTTADANEFASFLTSNSHYSDCWSCAGLGVKQSGDRLFQFNNLKRKIVDELFLS